ncbi:MAG: hypothetical protein ACJ779_01820 [Chloroflexota bacterium]
MAASGHRPRWDPDDRGIGVGDARGHLPVLDALRRAADEDGWVAEAPETHLLPHIVEAVAEGSPLAIDSTRTTAEGVCEIEARWIGGVPSGRGAIRAAAFRLIGSVAEASTVVHEVRGSDDEAIFEVMTGLLPDDTQFATHGHTLRLRIRDDG